MDEPSWLQTSHAEEAGSPLASYKVLTLKSSQVPSLCGLVFPCTYFCWDTFRLQQEPKALAPAPPEKNKGCCSDSQEFEKALGREMSRPLCSFSMDNSHRCSEMLTFAFEREKMYNSFKSCFKLERLWPQPIQSLIPSKISVRLNELASIPCWHLKFKANPIPSQATLCSREKGQMFGLWSPTPCTSLTCFSKQLWTLDKLLHAQASVSSSARGWCNDHHLTRCSEN